MKRLPLFPADKIMHAWPIATPVPTVYIYISSQRYVARVVERTRTSLPIFHGIVDRRGFRIETNNFTVSTSTTRRVDINARSPPVRAAFRCKLFDYLTKEREDLAVGSSACARCKMFQVLHSQGSGTQWLGYEVAISE